MPTNNVDLSNYGIAYKFSQKEAENIHNLYQKVINNTSSLGIVWKSLPEDSYNTYNNYVHYFHI